MGKIAEICCGSYYDAKQAYLAGAQRVELSCGLSVGGLTPTLSTVEAVKEEFKLNVAAIVRPRGAGFTYGDEDFYIMKRECKTLAEGGADGIVFGCLTAKKTLDREKCGALLEITKKYNRDAVFHRAFDCCEDPYKMTEELIELGFDRILTSGLKERTVDGLELLADLQRLYGDKIAFITAGHITSENVKQILDATGIRQAHSSCKTYVPDPSTMGENVSYAFLSQPYSDCFCAVSREEAERFVRNAESV